AAQRSVHVHVAVGDHLGALADQADDHQVGMARIDPLARAQRLGDDQGGGGRRRRFRRGGLGLGGGLAGGFGRLLRRGGAGFQGGGGRGGHRRGHVVGRRRIDHRGRPGRRGGQLHRRQAGRLGGLQIGAGGHHADGRQVVAAQRRQQGGPVDRLVHATG